MILPQAHRVALSRVAIGCGALVIALEIGACKEEKRVFEAEASSEAATAYCEQLFACTCVDSAGFGSQESCYATLNGQLNNQQAEAVMDALVYDASCVLELIDGVRDLACSRDPEDVAICSDCFAYHGLLPENTPCTHYGTFSDCDQGLACVTQEDADGDPIDLCTPACLRVGADQPCSLSGEEFHVLRDCDEGLVCDAQESGLCVPLPGPGAPCADGAVCGANAWCDGTSDPPICAALKDDDEGCAVDVECKSTWCRDGERCAQPLAADTPCDTSTDRCQAGLYCPEDFPRCAPTDAMVCQLPPIAF